ncbi:hypothetical protein pdam_00022342 [Pocillopora damicornis]|uniref:Uncharacterized protein n=1 Tax=Pocillopora damicornis TaxID=46731 RepID=A0A3M6TRH1_POCDA|nr:hypothetical protein pdam_00022342 [Pocillopora damicornis]
MTVDIFIHQFIFWNVIVKQATDVWVLNKTIHIDDTESVLTGIIAPQSAKMTALKATLSVVGKTDIVQDCPVEIADDQELVEDQRALVSYSLLVFAFKMKLHNHPSSESFWSVINTSHWPITKKITVQNKAHLVQNLLESEIILSRKF